MWQLSQETVRLEKRREISNTVYTAARAAAGAAACGQTAEVVQAWVGQIVTFSRSGPGSRFQKPPSY